ANDPHLRLSAPPVWYFAHLHAPGLDVVGATLPGVPGVIIGRNQRLAWGFTNTGSDVQDLYLERLLPDGRYLAPDGPRAFTVVRERIAVKGAADEDLVVRISRHGPVISRQSGGHVLALAWTALQENDASGEAIFGVARARDWPGWIPFDELPRVFNPRDGAVVNANHKTVPPGYRHFITSEWQASYRAN